MTLAQLKTEHARLVLQAAGIENARHLGKSTIHFDRDYTLAEADELTRLAIYNVELELEKAGAFK